MGQCTEKLNRSAHNDREHRSGRYRKSPKCDGCGKPVGTNYFTDDEVCGASDGPGFFLCDRKRCVAKRDLDIEARRALYTAQRAINDGDPPVIVKNSAQALAEVLRAVDAWQGMRGDSDAADTLAEVHDVLVRRGYATPCFGLSPKGQTAKAP